jgi:hypothetical protein
MTTHKGLTTPRGARPPHSQHTGLSRGESPLAEYLRATPPFEHSNKQFRSLYPMLAVQAARLRLFSAHMLATIARYTQMTSHACFGRVGGSNADLADERRQRDIFHSTLLQTL